MGQEEMKEISVGTEEILDKMNRRHWSGTDSGLWKDKPVSGYVSSIGGSICLFGPLGANRVMPISLPGPGQELKN